LKQRSPTITQIEDSQVEYPSAGHRDEVSPRRSIGADLVHERPSPDQARDACGAKATIPVMDSRIESDHGAGCYPSAAGILPMRHMTLPRSIESDPLCAFPLHPHRLLDLKVDFRPVTAI
jgi:hypothetical protein